MLAAKVMRPIQTLLAMSTGVADQGRQAILRNLVEMSLLTPVCVRFCSVSEAQFVFRYSARQKQPILHRVERGK